MSKQFTYKIHVDASPEHVWNILADFGGIQCYNPYVPHSRSLTENNGGVGAERYCELAPMGNIQERVLEWNEGQDYTLEIYQGEKQPPFKHARVTFGVNPGGQGCEVYMTVDYILKYGPVGAVMDAFIINRFMRANLPNILNGLKHYAETGEEVDREVFKRVRLLAVPA